MNLADFLKMIQKQVPSKLETWMIPPSWMNAELRIAVNDAIHTIEFGEAGRDAQDKPYFLLLAGEEFTYDDGC